MGETVGIVGLGLIGGSLAKALHAYTDRTVLGYDADGAVLTRALEEEVLSGVLTPERLAECDLVIVALYPAAAVEYVTCHRDQFRKGGLVFLFNFHPTQSQTDFFVPMRGHGKWRVIFSTDETRFGGEARIDEQYVYQTRPDERLGEGFSIYSPCRTALVLAQLEEA